MPPRVGDVWKVRHYHYPMMITEAGGGSLTLAPADRSGDGWIHYGMFRLIVRLDDSGLTERIYEAA